MTNQNSKLATSTVRTADIRTQLKVVLTGLMILNDQYEKIASGNTGHATFPYQFSDAKVELSASADAYKMVLAICSFANLKKLFDTAQNSEITEDASMKMLKAIYLGLQTTEQLLKNNIELGWAAAPNELNREQSEIYVQAQRVAFNHALEMCNYSVFIKFVESGKSD